LNAHRDLSIFLIMLSRYLIVIFALSEIASLRLLLLDRLEQSLEVSCTKSVVVSPLNYLNKNCWPVLDWLRKYLEQVALLVKVHEDVQLSNHIEVLCDLCAHVAKSLGQIVVICWWNCQKLAASVLHSGHGIDDGICSQGDVLDAWTTEIINVLLNL